MKFINNGFARVAIVTAVVLLMPLIAMQYTNEVIWDKADFIVMGALCLCMGNLFVLVSRIAPKRHVLFGVIFLVTFIYIWAELAVGIYFH